MTTMTAPLPTTCKSHPYQHILRLVEQLSSTERLQLIAHIANTMPPLIDDDDDEEILLQEAMEAVAYARAHPETVMSLDEFEAELDRAEVAGELPC